MTTEVVMRPKTETQAGNVFLHPRVRQGEVLRPKGKETHYGTEPEAEPFDVDADWEERA